MGRYKPGKHVARKPVAADRRPVEPETAGEKCRLGVATQENIPGKGALVRQSNVLVEVKNS